MTRKGNKGREETGSQGDTRTYTIKESENVEDKRKLRTEEGVTGTRRQSNRGGGRIQKEQNTTN